MLTDKQVAAILPAKDIERARDFYENKLGLEVQGEVGGGMILSAGLGSALFIYQKEDMVSATHTVAGFNVENIEKEVADLKSRGVVFEEYDMPGMETVDGVASFEGAKSAWFKDSEGNILSLNQM